MTEDFPPELGPQMSVNGASGACCNSEKDLKFEKMEEVDSDLKMGNSFINVENPYPDFRQII